MPTDRARPQTALAAVDGLTTLALLRAAVRTPTVLFGVMGLVVVIGFGVMDRLRTVGLSGLEMFALVALVGLGVGVAAVAGARRELDGPFGFALMPPAQQAALALRRGGAGLGLGLMVVAALVAVARPDLLIRLMPAALAGGLVGSIVGTALGWLSGRVGAGLPSQDLRGRSPALSWLGRAIGPIVLIGLALQAQVYGATTQAQMLGLGAGVAAVLMTLPVDPIRLNLLAATPQSMARLVLPFALPPMVVGTVAGLAAGLVAGLAPAVAIGAGLALGLVGGMARMFLGLAALGRSDRAARTAGTIELLLILVLPIAGPLAIGSAALIWIGGRLVWLWRRGKRVRWLDPEGER